MQARKLWLAILLCAFKPALYAESLQGPQLGLMFDSAKGALRPILGIAGASTLGSPFDLGDLTIADAIVAPNQNYALAIAGSDHGVRLIRFGVGNALQVSGLAGAAPGPDRMMISPAGTAAAFYYAATRRIATVGGLPLSPRVTADIHLSTVLSPLFLAVSDDGGAALAAMEHTVYAVTEKGEIPVASSLGRVSAVAFVASRDALIADGATNQIYLVRDTTGSESSRVLAGPADAISNPVAVAASADGRRAFVANAKTKTITILDLSGEGKPAAISCACQPSGLQRMGDGGLFRVTEFSARPIWLLDAGLQREPRMVFVPPDKPAAVHRGGRQ